jgi:hypothetical protein
MKARMLAIVALALLGVAAGCRTDPRIALLEAESRRRGDRIYQLQDLLAQYQQALAACRGTSSPGLAPAVTQPAADSGPALAEPARTEGRRSAAPSGTSPVLGPHSATVPAGPPAPRRVPQGPPNSPSPSGSSPLPSTQPHGAWRIGAPSRQVAAITIDRTFTGGYNGDGRPGDKGITLALQPRDAQGRLVAAAAPVSVVVLDPAEQGQAARVGRWDFTAQQIAATTQSTRLSEGIHLAMIWPGKPPAHGRLHLFVRYTTIDGRKLQADQAIDVDVAGRQARRWMAAPAAVEPVQPDPAPAAPAPVSAEASPPPSSEPSIPTIQPPSPDPRPAQPQQRRPVWSPNR